ncbi:GNAT family N-acetyltransferase [Ichthyenterobacterium sp. W332]|uniref:GNAT family N-acetyltransferase n=1 Tax=Microcosmobacter mediterraneus TaxID=3075607 RepID=A0ABU2YHV8_9FLAO|nr:GNAT family N-acetyltransferase [Ichthyenterobacterium sp. W332]MDT0557754.1 GNAT family N-acetyltransferase [Ichthyenterobacterium sp. W332]
MKVRHLGDTDFDVIMECFLSAFENYFVKMPTDHDYYRQRWKAAGVRYDLSYGMFDGHKLVGFIINAIDKRHGNHIAFNTGTGVISEYRGQKIVNSIYDFAFPILKKEGIIKCVLEVITVNERAIKAYEGIGFRKTKHYKCYSGTINSEHNTGLELQEVQYDVIDWSTIPNQANYSWDFYRESLEKGNSKYFFVNRNSNFESFVAINPDNGTLNQLEVFTDKKDTWQRLFSAINSKYQNVRVINVDDKLTSKINAIESVGLENTVDQFEMELFLVTEPVEVK